MLAEESVCLELRTSVQMQEWTVVLPTGAQEGTALVDLQTSTVGICLMTGEDRCVGMLSLMTELSWDRKGRTIH